MDGIAWQRIPVSRAAAITMVACRLPAGFLVGRPVALQRDTDSLDKHLKFIAAQDDESFAGVRNDSFWAPSPIWCVQCISLI
jgi:hypothetical protein